MCMAVLRCVFPHTQIHQHPEWCVSVLWMWMWMWMWLWLCLYMWMRVLITHREIVAHSIHVSNNWRHLIHTSTHTLNEAQARELSDSINHVCIMLLLHLQSHWYQMNQNKQMHIHTQWAFFPLFSYLHSNLFHVNNIHTWNAIQLFRHSAECLCMYVRVCACFSWCPLHDNYDYDGGSLIHS